MSVTNVQLVKWSFPAFAIIVGFFWYKRRRVDRLDPGGNTDVNGKNNINNKRGLNIYDSGINIDETFTGLNSSNHTTEEIMCTPRKVSENLDIPSKSKPIKCGRLSNDNKPWYEDDDVDIDEELLNVKTNIVYGSNPNSSNFDMMEKCRSLSMENKDTVKMSKVDENINEEEEAAEAESAITGNDEKNKNIENCTKTNNKTNGQVICERDSANHSPVSGVLDGSVSDEVRSEGSTDSGKGGSINGKGLKSTNSTTYEFELPSDLVGSLIGRRGAIIKSINDKANVRISISAHPTDDDEMKLCIIKGQTENINIALDIIRQKFPLKKFPDVTLEEVHLSEQSQNLSWSPELTQLYLTENINNDVMVCNIVEPNRFFIQLPTHPTYPTLRILDFNMTQLYNTVESPPVPDKLTKGMLVVAKFYDRWVRALIEEPDENGENNLVRLVDHGGFWTFRNSDMRKIRSDYIPLPLQAIEVVLANVKPIDGVWQQEAYDIVSQLTSGVVGQAQIEAYGESTVYISLYINIPKHGVISIAHELVARGLAEATSFEELAPEENNVPTL